ncbi:PrpF domain-containing protein [Sciscionella marina]|uniref:PrpF domain-containing protein n=1 Tax=Sciscionella marina TaxID=508770 RepID=UPI000361FFC7|nr:PrpF domain-containing protein [Sciscionella marina]
MATTHGQVEPIRGTLVRGGTSKCWLFDATEVSPEREALERVWPAAFGSADAEQLDGVGAGTSTTSKAAVVGSADAGDVDVQYTFGQVGIGDRRVEWGSNCGNCATAVGLYAVHNGFVAPHGDDTRVRMWNGNTGARIDAVVRTPGGVVPRHGGAVVPGVTGHGVGVDLEFRHPVGPATGRLLPTGNALDFLNLQGNPVPLSLVDAGAPAALLDAGALGLAGTEPLPRFAEALHDLLPLRAEAAVRMGLRAPQEPVDHAVPKLGVVGPPADYHTTEGKPVGAGEFDIAVRMASMHAPHPSIGLTSVVAVLAAAIVPGSTVERITGTPDGPLRIGTPAGVVTGMPVLDADGELTGVWLSRSARVLAEATIYVPAAPVLAGTA